MNSTTDHAVEWFAICDDTGEDGLCVRVSQARGIFPRRFSIAIGMKRPDGSLRQFIPVFPRNRKRAFSLRWLVDALGRAENMVNEEAARDE